MFVLERPPGARVIEARRAPVRPLDERELSSCMIRVTRRAIGAPGASVQAAILLCEPCDLTMTRQAAARHAGFASAMTLRAVERPVE
jgi:hypothetical protein